MDLSSRRSLGTVFIVLLVALLVCQGIRIGLEHAAQRFLKEATATVDQAETDLQAATTELKAAREKHLAVYLEKFSPTQAISELQAARDSIAKAKSTRRPSMKTRFAREAVVHSQKVKAGYAGWHEEIAFLDQALANYQGEPGKLAAMVKQLEADVKAFERMGYFTVHFAPARKTNASAHDNHDKAISLVGRKLQQGLPDYRAIYVSCLEGERLCTEARKLASAVPEMKGTNDRRIADFPSCISIVEGRYNRAQFVAGQLERYPKYRMSVQVQSAYEQMSTANDEWNTAKALNEMKVQRFVEAKNSLDRANQIADNALEVFGRAEDRWTQMQNAIAGIPGQRSAARSAINRARSYASQWSENSQSEAESLISEAEDQFNLGQANEGSDPISSVSYFAQAKDLGDKAHNAVDDVDHTPPPSSSNWGSGSGGGGGSIGGGGFGGSDYGGGG
ncbi:MAG: hypothetical protein WC080_04590, partial [Patescibacteria group bacterium]